MQITFRETGAPHATGHWVHDTEPIRLDSGIMHLEATPTVVGGVKIRNTATQGFALFMPGMNNPTISDATGPEDLPEPKDDVERMLRAGLWNIVDDFVTGYSVKRAALDRLFRFTTQFQQGMEAAHNESVIQAGGLIITDELVEDAAKAVFLRGGHAWRGCTWEGRKGTTEAVREEFRGNARALFQFIADKSKAAELTNSKANPTLDDYPAVKAKVEGGKWDAVTIKEVEYDPADHEAKTTYVAPPEPLTGDALARIQHVHQEITRLVGGSVTYAVTDQLVQFVLERMDAAARREEPAETAKEAPVPALLTFGQFWDAMAEHLTAGADLAVFTASDGRTYSAHRGIAEDGTRAEWRVIFSEYGHTGGAKHRGVTLHSVSHLSDFRVLNTYWNAQDVPF